VLLCQRRKGNFQGKECFWRNRFAACTHASRVPLKFRPNRLPPAEPFEEQWFQAIPVRAKSWEDW
jgi:hypothetical protein